MKKIQKLDQAERFEIAILLRKDYSHRAIAEVLGRSHNTVSYEVRKNSVKGMYDPKKAHAKVRVRRHDAKFQWKKIDHDDTLRTYIITGLNKHWNPDQIAGRMKLEKKPFFASKTAIYEWLYSVRGQKYCYLLYSERYHRKKRKPKSKREMISNRVGIEKRPLEASLRMEYGHFEGDAIVSKKGCKGGLSVLSERKSKLVRIRKLFSLSPTENLTAITSMKQTLCMKSITFDNGLENKKHTLLGIDTYFCDPYSPWQKGGVEHANKMIRRYFPKGTDFVSISVKSIRKAENLINKKPRKILGYRTALEVASEYGVYLKKGNFLKRGSCTN
jgi:IS30 family transposase